MQKIYGYCRISTKQQNIDRQVRNILARFPNAEIHKERFTGTKMQGRKELDKILKQVQSGDTMLSPVNTRLLPSASACLGHQLSLLS